MQVGDFQPQVYEQIEQNCKRIPQRIYGWDYDRGPLAIVCYGPSLQESWSTIENYTNIMTCSGAHDFVLNHGRCPTWHVEADWREHKANFVSNPDPRTEYLIASCVHPKMLDNLQNESVYLWHTDFEPFYQYPVETHPSPIFRALGSVGLQCIPIAHYKGFRELHIFGMDCSFDPSGQRHAGPHNGLNNDKTLWVQVGDKEFLTSLPFLMYAKMFVEIVKNMPDTKFMVAGNGLLQEYLKELSDQTRQPVDRGVRQGISDQAVQQTDRYS